MLSESTTSYCPVRCARAGPAIASRHSAATATAAPRGAMITTRKPALNTAETELMPSLQTIGHLTECTVVNYNIMARSSHTIVRDAHISRLTLAMYLEHVY